MRTIRQNVFETNSSSMHAVCILTETEYDNIKRGKGLIAGEDHYVEINADTVKKYFKECSDYLEKRNAENKANIEELKNLKGRAADSLTNKEKSLLLWDTALFKSYPEKAIEKGLEQLNNNILENEESFEKLNNEDFIKKITDKILYYIDSLQSIKENEFDYEEADMTEEEFEYFQEFLSDYDNIDSFGYGYENSNVDSRNINGQEIYVLSYSGYN